MTSDDARGLVIRRMQQWAQQDAYLRYQSKVISKGAGDYTKFEAIEREAKSLYAKVEEALDLFESCVYTEAGEDLLASE